MKFKNKVRETLTLAGGDNGPRDAETSSRKERAKQCVRTFVPKCAWWKKASLAETLDDRNYQLKQKTSLLHALAKRFADRTAELGVVKTELAARDEVIAVQRSKIREAARVNLDNSNTNLVLSRKLKEFRNLYKVREKISAYTTLVVGCEWWGARGTELGALPCTKMGGLLLCILSCIFFLLAASTPTSAAHSHNCP